MTLIQMNISNKQRRRRRAADELSVLLKVDYTHHYALLIPWRQLLYLSEERFKNMDNKSRHFPQSWTVWTGWTGPRSTRRRPRIRGGRSPPILTEEIFSYPDIISTETKNCRLPVSTGSNPCQVHF